MTKGAKVEAAKPRAGRAQCFGDQPDRRTLNCVPSRQESPSFAVNRKIGLRLRFAADSRHHRSQTHQTGGYCLTVVDHSTDAGKPSSRTIVSTTRGLSSNWRIPLRSGDCGIRGQPNPLSLSQTWNSRLMIRANSKRFRSTIKCRRCRTIALLAPYRQACPPCRHRMGTEISSPRL